MPCLSWYINIHKQNWYRYIPVTGAPPSHIFASLPPSLAEILHPPRPSTICGGADHADPTRNHSRNTRARVQEEVGHERRPVPTNLSTVV